MSATTARTPKPASDKQIDLLQDLCERLGETYTPPATSAAAHREISRLIAQDNTNRPARTPAPPTARQLQHLRTLAMRTGQTFVTPASKVAAIREIDRLSKQPSSSRVERYLDKQAVWNRETHAAPAFAAVRDDELTGYGSTATWR
jgi:hypothetical protein